MSAPENQAMRSKAVWTFTAANARSTEHYRNIRRWLPATPDQGHSKGTESDGERDGTEQCRCAKHFAPQRIHWTCRGIMSEELNEEDDVVTKDRKSQAELDRR